MKVRSSLELSLCTEQQKPLLALFAQIFGRAPAKWGSIQWSKTPEVPNKINLYGGKISFHEHCLVKRLLGIGSKSQVKPLCSLFWVSANRRNSLISIIGQTSSREVAKQKVAVNSILQCGLSSHFYLLFAFKIWILKVEKRKNQRGWEIDTF